MARLDRGEPIKIVIAPAYNCLVNSLCPKCKDALLWHNYQTKGANLCRVERNLKKERREAVNDEYAKKPTR